VIGRFLALGLLLSCCAGCASLSAGPADSGAADSLAVVSSSSDRPLVELTVRVALFGGPMKPDGTMADMNTPARGIAVTVTDSTGVTDRRTTGLDGSAIFPVAPGRWTVTSTCGNPQTLDVATSTNVAVQCDVP
jgi:hypothetical protein